MSYFLILAFTKKSKAAFLSLSLKIHILIVLLNSVRAGQLNTFLAKYLVPGDIVYLNIGDRVPADVRLFEVGFCIFQNFINNEKTSCLITGNIFMMKIGDRFVN